MSFPLTDPRRFWLYAHPCGEVKVAKGTLAAATLKSVRDSLAAGRLPVESPGLFDVAMAMLEMTAREMGKTVIDDAVLEQYFWRSHTSLVHEEAKHRDDIVPDFCIVWPARVVAVDAVGASADVETPVGRRKVNISMLPGLKPGAFVTVHYDYACEQLTAEQFDLLWNSHK